MKRFMLLMAALAALTVALTSANARTDGTDQARSICHRTGSATRPYVKLRVSARRSGPIPNHPGGHRSGAGRRVSEDAPRRQRRDCLQRHAHRQRGEPRGRSRRDRHGDCSGCGPARARSATASRRDNLAGAAVAMHIHKGAAGVAGPVVIPLATPNADGKAAGCAGVSRALVGQILASPARST